MKNLIPLGECWHDSTLERIIIEYDTISVEIETDKKRGERGESLS